MKGLERRRDVARVVVIAGLISLGIETFLEVIVGQYSDANLVARIIGYPVALAFFWAVGWWLGTRTWPRRGARLLRRTLRRRIREKSEFMFLSDRPDRQLPLYRRVWEVVGFSAGLSLMVTGGLILLDAPALTVRVVAALLPAATLWGSFLLVPYWLFSRLGIRIVDPVRWLILPLSRRYADRLKLSNGALALLGVGAIVNVAMREGATGPVAVTVALTDALRLVASILIVAAAAVVYYIRDERGLAHQLELEAIQMGLQDGRGMSDGDFLPRLPKRQAEA